MKIVQKANLPLLLVFTGISFFSGFQMNNTEGVSIGPDNTPPHPSAMLEVMSNSKGVLVPRVSVSQRNSIASPANSLLVYVTDANESARGFHYYDGVVSQWKKLGAGFSVPKMTYAQMEALPKSLDDVGKLVYVTDSSPVVNATFPQSGNVCIREAYVHGLWYLGIFYHNCGSSLQWQRMQHDYGTPTGGPISNCAVTC